MRCFLKCRTPMGKLEDPQLNYTFCLKFWKWNIMIEWNLPNSGVYRHELGVLSDKCFCVTYLWLFQVDTAIRSRDVQVREDLLKYLKHVVMVIRMRLSHLRWKTSLCSLPFMRKSDTGRVLTVLFMLLISADSKASFPMGILHLSSTGYENFRKGSM